MAEHPFDILASATARLAERRDSLRVRVDGRVIGQIRTRSIVEEDDRLKLYGLGRIDIQRIHIIAAARCTKPVKWMVRRS